MNEQAQAFVAKLPSLTLEQLNEFLLGEEYELRDVMSKEDFDLDWINFHAANHREVIAAIKAEISRRSNPLNQALNQIAQLPSPSRLPTSSSTKQSLHRLASEIPKGQKPAFVVVHVLREAGVVDFLGVYSDPDKAADYVDTHPTLSYWDPDNEEQKEGLMIETTVFKDQ